MRSRNDAKMDLRRKKHRYIVIDREAEDAREIHRYIDREKGRKRERQKERKTEREKERKGDSESNKENVCHTYNNVDASVTSENKSRINIHTHRKHSNENTMQITARQKNDDTRKIETFYIRVLCRINTDRASLCSETHFSERRKENVVHTNKHTRTIEQK